MYEIVEIIYGYRIDGLEPKLNAHVSARATGDRLDPYYGGYDRTDSIEDVDWVDLFGYWKLDLYHGNKLEEPMMIGVVLDSWACADVRPIGEVTMAPSEEHKSELARIMAEIFEEFPELADFFEEPEILFVGTSS